MLDICTSSLMQGALDIFIKSGMYDTHLAKVHACYKRKLLKAKLMVSQICPPGLDFHIPKQGLFIWLRLPVNVSADHIIETLKGYGIRIGTSSQFYVTEADQTLRLSICSVPEEDLTALMTVIEVIKQEMLLQ